MSEKEYPLTKEGYEKLLRKKEQIEKELRDAGQRAGEAAGQNSDWHDNPAYDDAVLDMQMLNHQLGEVNEILKNAKIVTALTLGDVVEIGSQVTLIIDGEREEYFIGGEGEGDPSSGIIGYNSPLGRAILNQRAGETVKIETPSGGLSVKIVEIK